MEASSTQKNKNSNYEEDKRLILSRDSCYVGSSSSIYYYSEPVGIPFEWEDSPGKPKNPEQLFDFVRPLSPPPAMQSPCRVLVAASSSIPLKSWLLKVVFGGRRDQQTGERGGNKVDLRYHPQPQKPHSSTFKDGSLRSFQIDDCSSGGRASEPSGSGIKKWKNISRIMVCATRGF